MGIIDGARAALCGSKAYRIHVAANKLVDQRKPVEAGEKFRQALALYDKGNRLGTMEGSIQRGYVVLLMREGRFEDAREQMLRMSKRPGMSEADWFSLRVQFSLYQWKTGQLDKAIETIRRAASFQMNGLVYSTLGMYLVDKARQTGVFAEALDFNEKALEYDDEDGAVLDNMGQLYEAMAAAAEGEKAAEYRSMAVEYYEKAHASRPRQITTLYYLARICHQDGNDDRARKLLSARDELYISAMCPVTRDMMEALAMEIG